MTEPKRPHQGSRDEKAAAAVQAELAETREELAEAREEIAEAREEIAGARAGIEVAREGIEEAVDTAFILSAATEKPPILPPDQVGGASALTQIIEAEIAALGDNLSPYQQGVLADLLGLHFSLRGPQRLLESSGNFNRPVFPIQQRRR